MKSPALFVAFLSFMGVIFSATAAFFGVILTPVLLPIMHTWGLL